VSQQRGGVSGRITNASTGAALASLQVAIYTSSGSYVTSAFSDASGLYSNTTLSTGSYYLRTWNNKGYIDEVYNDVACLACSLSSGTVVSVSAGSTRTGLDFALTPGATLSGKVTAVGSGAPLSGVGIDIL
jgi:hypothetical protein